MSDATKSTSEIKTGKLDQLKRVGEIRDGILVAGGILYVLGYVSWSIHAWTNNLGLLPALDAQYFIAGLFPALVVGLVWLGIKFSWNYSKPAPWWINPKANLSGWKLVLRRGLLSIIYLIYGWPLLLPITKRLVDWPPGEPTENLTLLFAVLTSLQLLISIGVLFFYNPPAEKEEPTVPERLRRFFMVYLRMAVVAIIGSVALGYYVMSLYSKVPQALGGVRPRCAYLDIRRTGVSNETLKSILPVPSPTPSPQATPAASPSEPEITRTDKLNLLFSGSDYVLIEVNGSIYEIKKDVIHAVQNCPDPVGGGI